MQTASYTGNHTIEIGTGTPAAPTATEVRIEVAYTGICGTDLHILHGSMDSRVKLPIIIGHEMSGVIAGVGDQVTQWNVGDHVTVMPLDWCGHCPACRAGNQHVCQNLNFIGIDSPGALQGSWNVQQDVLVRLPKDLRLDHAALVEPTAVSVHDVRRSGLVAGEKAVVIGGGPIGVLIATTARHFGADVVVIELDENRRKAIADLGFPVLDPRADDQAEWVNRWTDGAGADVVFEVSGSAAAVLASTELVKVRGRLVVVAIHPEPRPIDLKRLFWRELTIIGTRVYQREDFDKAVEMLAEGVVPADLLITRIEPLSATADAFAALSSGQAMKILIDCQSDANAPAGAAA
ncbi:alcohol dehydrogenase catalytic domain-containing protein [Parafrigoribacterium mesophilum]|uniref:zinc-dependent alcohol dehydrogenase n=1 Tax=Parafrigoribacterium mesophilum TaxID=433646 RepID=UPI0031FD3427